MATRLVGRRLFAEKPNVGAHPSYMYRLVTCKLCYTEGSFRILIYNSILYIFIKIVFRSNRQGRPKNVGVAVKIESRAKVSYKGGHILKLSDKVTMTRAFTARKKNRPAILFFS